VSEHPIDTLIRQIEALLALEERGALTPRVPAVALELLKDCRVALIHQNAELQK
jgi:hypothetical protein